MHVIVCLDDCDGMLFHSRRQSRDRVVIQDICQLCEGGRLWMNSYSADLFASFDGTFLVDEHCLKKAGEQDYCFVENLAPGPYQERIGRLIVYRWNRHYPADMFLDISLDDWNLKEQSEQPGYSHERITREIYTKE